MNDNLLKISVIIPTYKGAHKVVNALKSLELQTFQDFETLVVVDGSTDSTKEIVENSSFNLSSLKIIEKENGGRSKVRNAGAEEAESDLIIFMDDDMRFTPEVIKQHTLHHQNYPNSILAGNQIEDPTVIKNDIQSYKRNLSLKWLLKYDKGINKLNSSTLFLTAANMSIPKELFTRLGGFDESLTDTEDKMLALKALEKGVDVYFNNDIIAWHDDFITCKSYIKRRREYEKAQTAANLDTPALKFIKLV